MKHFPVTLCALLLTGLSAKTVQAEAKPGWTEDQAAALQRAKADNKRVLMDFTGSDWCIWCIKLDQEVFSRPEFQAYARKNLVLVEVDFPNRKRLAPNIAKQNEALASRYQVESYPTVIVLDAKGRKLGELQGYEGGGPKAFIAALEKLPKA